MAFLAEGWSWVDIHLGDCRLAGLSSRRLHPEWREPTDAEQAELDRLSAEIETLDAELDANAEENDARWSQRDDLEAAYEAVRQAGRCWPAEIKQLSGVVLAIAHDGSVCATEGAVRTEDEKRVDAHLRAKRAGECQNSDREPDGEDTHAHVSALPKAVNRDLMQVRTRAIRQGLSGDGDIALALCVASLAHRCLHHMELPGVAISGKLQPADDLPGLADARSALRSNLPDNAVDLLNWALDLSRDRLLAVLGVLVASTVDLAHEDATPADLAKQCVADQLSQRLDIDMRAFWSPGFDFWVRLPKAALLSAFADAPAMSDRSASACVEALKTHAKLRKDELAAKVCAAFEGAGYLPDILATPVAAGVFEVTPEGVAGASRVAMAAE